MRRFRFRIGSLLILVAFLGVGFAALREANHFWESLVLTASFGILLVSILLAVHRRAERRAFWIGFALFGWGYLGLTMIPSIEPRLLTSWGLTQLDALRAGDRALLVTDGSVRVNVGNNATIASSSVAFSPNGSSMVTSNKGSLQIWSTGGRLIWAGGTTESFVQIGHSFVALILAWLGGQLSRLLHVRNQEPSPAVAPSVEAPGVD